MFQGFKMAPLNFRPLFHSQLRMRTICPFSLFKITIISVTLCIICSNAEFNFTILHSGHTRAHYLAVNVSASNTRNLPCPPTYTDETSKELYDRDCMGGWDSRTTFVNEVRARHGANNVLVLDSGNTLPGTLFFPLYKSEMASTYHGELGYDAWNIGSRDWDGGATTFLDFVQELDTFGVKVTTTNLNFTRAGTSYSKVLQSATVTRAGTQIKIIGLADPNIMRTARIPSQVTLFPNEINRMLQVIGTSKIVIMLSSAESYEEDLAIMSVLSNQIDIVVSSYNGFYYGNSDSIESNNWLGEYPKVHGSGTPSSPYWLLVSPARFGKGMGYLNVTFNNDGFITSWEGDHVWLNRTLYVPDPTVEADLKTRYDQLVEFSSAKLGETKVLLVGDGGDSISPCRWRECNLGSLIADIIRNYSSSDIAFISSGNLGTNITGPNVTYGDVLSMLPFFNNIAIFQVQGQTIADMLEHSVSRVFAPFNMDASERFLQVSGIRFSWKIGNPIGSRVSNIQVFNSASQTFGNLDTRATYSVATTNSIYNGNYGYNEVGLPQNTINSFPFGPLITDLMIDYFAGKNGFNAVNVPDITTRIIPTEPLPCTSSPPSVSDQTISYQCVDGVWVVNQSIAVSSGARVSGGLEIVGNFTLPTNSTLILTTIKWNTNRPLIDVIGCAEIDGLISIELSDSELGALDSLGGQRTLTVIRAQCGLINQTRVHTVSNKKSCKKAVTSRVPNQPEDILNVVFKIEKSSCSRWWILLASVAGGLIVIVIIIALVITLTPLVKVKKIEKSKRNMGRQPTTPCACCGKDPAVAHETKESTSTP